VRGLELEEGVDAKVDGEYGVLVGRVVPLKVVVCTNEEGGGVGKTLIYGGKGSVVGAMD